MKKVLLVAVMSAGLALTTGSAVVSADQGLLKLTEAQMDTVDAGGKRHYRRSSAWAESKAKAEAYGRHTATYTKTWAYADADYRYSGSGSHSTASASN